MYYTVRCTVSIQVDAHCVYNYCTIQYNVFFLTIRSGLTDINTKVPRTALTMHSVALLWTLYSYIFASNFQRHYISACVPCPVSIDAEAPAKTPPPPPSL